ncbi:MAG TPA: hypothetical protein ENI87_02570 [bacterium]|nr:hypothetical protein [bacterium]
MIRVLPMTVAAAMAIAARGVARHADGQRARSLAAAATAGLIGLLLLLDWLVVAAGLPASFELAGIECELERAGWQRTMPFVDLVIALLAIGLAPVASHPPRTLATILLTIAIAIAFQSLDEPITMSLLWGASVLLVARELLRLEGRASAVVRAFRRYQGVSVAAIIVGAIAFASGNPTFGAVMWLLAIALREAILPLHGWLPLFASRAPLGLLVALVAPQPGVYAQLTVCGDITGGALAHDFAIFAALTGIAAAALGVVQTDARRAACWLIISQTGLIAFGLENASLVGRTGAVLSWQVMALGTSGFVMTIAALEARRGTLSLREPGGSFARTPRMAVAFLLLGFASVALPGTLGFVAEDLLVQGSVDEYPLVGFAVVIATALNGINVMRSFFVLFSGTTRHTGEHDLTRLEAGVLSVVLAVLLVGGALPRSLLSPEHPPTSPSTPPSDH